MVFNLDKKLVKKEERKIKLEEIEHALKKIGFGLCKRMMVNPIYIYT